MVAIYARQSVDRADSISIESQIEYCLHEAKGEEYRVYEDATVIIGLKQNPTHGRRFSPIFFA